jgi:hypothetical protein
MTGISLEGRGDGEPEPRSEEVPVGGMAYVI